MRDHPIKSLLLNFVLIVILSASDTLTLKQVILDYKELTPENLEQLHWISKTDYFVFCQDSVVYQQSKPGDARDILYLNDLNGSLQKCGLSQLKSLPYMHWHNTDTFYFWKGDTLILYDLQGYTVTQMTVLPDSAENKDISNKDFHIAYTMENNLYIKKADGSQHQLTDKEKEIVSGQSVARHEFGIHGGTFWSPRDSYLAFYQKDESRVDDYPFVNYDS
jgi:dipeptidyl-peptidase-4